MRDMNSRKIVFFIVTAVLVFFLFNPFGGGKPSARGTGRAAQKAILAYTDTHFIKPENLVLSMFDTDDVVLIGEQQRIAEQVDFVKELIPRLYDAGVYALGIEYANAADQELIDGAISAPEYDEAAVRRILFDYLVIWGFSEYEDLFEAAWKVNRNLAPGQAPFRILGLNIERNWEVLKTREDLENPQKKRAVISAGLPDQVMADTLLSYLRETGGKAAVLCDFQSAFTEFRFPQYVERAKAEGFPSTLRFGNFLYRELDGRVAVVLLHGPWLDNSQMSGVNYPMNGAIDKMLRSLPPDRRSFGVRVGGTPYAALPVSGNFERGSAGLTLGDLADGYVVLGPISEYTPVTPIAGFIDEGNFKEAIRNFPGPDPGTVSADDLNGFISTITEDTKKMLDNFR